MTKKPANNADNSKIYTTFALVNSRACGEIGRRARLRIWCFATCRFESYHAHDWTKEEFSKKESSSFFENRQCEQQKVGSPAKSGGLRKKFAQSVKEEL